MNSLSLSAAAFSGFCLLTGNFLTPQCCSGAQSSPGTTQDKQGKPQSKASSRQKVQSTVSALTPVYGSYLELQSQLAGDNFREAARAMVKLSTSARSVKTKAWPRDAQREWGKLLAALDKGGRANSIAKLRVRFAKTSDAIVAVHDRFGHAGKEVFHRIHCSMALESGADWLQVGKSVRNPYFGKRMLTCGNVRGTFAGTPVTLDQVRNSGALTAVYDSYLALQAQLAADNFKRASKSLARLTTAARLLSKQTLPASVHGSRDRLRTALGRAEKATSIAPLRVSFAKISEGVLSLLKVVGHSGERVLYRLHCSMALGNKGASWLQADKQTSNPYFGASMLRCGAVREEFPGNKGKTTKEEEEKKEK